MNRLLLIAIGVLIAFSTYSSEFIFFKTPGLEGQFVIQQTSADLNGELISSDLWVCNAITAQPASNGVALNLSGVTAYHTSKTIDPKTKAVNADQSMIKISRTTLILDKYDRIICGSKIMFASTFLLHTNEFLKKFPITTNGVIIPRIQ